MCAWSSSDEFFERLFTQDLEEIEYVHHPSDEVLRVYLSGHLSRAWREPEALLSRLEEGAPRGWHHQEVSAHVFTCRSCRERAYVLQAEASPKHSIWARIDEVVQVLRERLAPVPRPALATMAVEFVLIVGLVGLLFLQPTPLFPKPAVPAAGTAASAAMERRSLPQAPALEMAGFPLPVAQALQTLTQDPNPESRLAAAQSLESYANLQLVEPLVHVWEKEKTPPVRQALFRVISFSFVRTRDQFSSAAQMYERIREQHAQEFQFSFNLGFDLGGLWQDLSVFRVEAQYPSALALCVSQPDLSLEQLSNLVSEFGGVLVIDRSLPMGSFRLRLPLTVGAEQTLSRLQSQAGIVCQR